MSETVEYKTPAGRLTEEGVKEIRARRARKETYTQIALALDITTGTVYSVLKGRTWRWLA